MSMNCEVCNFLGFRACSLVGGGGGEGLHIPMHVYITCFFTSYTKHKLSEVAHL